MAYLAIAFATILLVLTIFSHLRVKPIGPWFVECYEVTVELVDREGKIAYARRKMRIRAEVPYIDSFMHTDMWADERIADFEIKPGRIIEQYQDIGRTIIVQKFDRPFKRNEIADCEISYTLYDSFTRTNEYFNVAISKPSKKIILRVIFPQDRLCKTYQMIHFQGDVSLLLKDGLILQERSDGRQELFWKKDKPMYLTSYRVLWSW